MKTIYELVKDKFTKKSVGNKSSHIAEVRSDEPNNIGWRMADYSEKPYISFKITEEDIYNDLTHNQQ
jgi:hypothetical protein